ncbi:O-antigen ligase family protein [Thiopseudomonas alkaliphila]|nr:O-antigen ligase family protein [Thiopseudomonas alkaliphila]
MAFITGIYLLDADVLFNGFSNPRFLNQFQILFMPILAYLALHHWQAAHRYSKLLASIIFTTLLIQWCIAFSLGGRGLWLGLAVSHAALIILFPRFWRLLGMQATAGLLGFILFYLMFTVVPEWLGQTSVIRDSMRFGLSKREVIWQLAWDIFLAHPWLGVGPMHFSAEVNSVAAHPHQVVLQWLAEWGIFATLAAIFIAVWGMLHGLRFVRSEKGQPLDAALWMSILGALALAQVDGVFVMPYTETWLAILIGLAMARWSKPSAAESRWQTYSLRILAIPVILVLGSVLINEAPTLAQDSQAHMEKHGTGYTPRFWMQGWIPMDP